MLHSRQILGLKSRHVNDEICIGPVLIYLLDSSIWVEYFFCFWDFTFFSLYESQRLDKQNSLHVVAKLSETFLYIVIVKQVLIWYNAFF